MISSELVSFLSPSKLRVLGRQVNELPIIPLGTNWHTPVATCLKAHASRSKDLKIASRSSEDWDHFAHLWRSAFFKFVSKLSERDEMMNGHKVFQETLTMVLKEMLGADYKEGDWDATVRGDLVASWGMADGETAL